MAIYKGNTKIVKLYKGTTQIIKRYKGTDLIYSASRLPAEFQEVEYIESSGTQYIDTLVSMTPYLAIKTILQYTSTANNQLNGVLSGATLYRLQFGILNNNFWIGIGNNKQFNLGISPDLSKHTFVLDLLNKQYGIDNNILTDSSIIGGTENKNIYLFTFLNGYTNVPLYYSSQKLYSCKIYDNNILVRNFVPCYRKLDNVAGLYDLVNGVFYTNAGSGTFIVGGNV